MVETALVVALLVAVSGGGAIGTALIALGLSRQYTAREVQLSREIDELRARVDELQTIVNSVVRQRGGLNITAQSGASVDIGGDAVGNDRRSTGPLTQ